MAPPWINTRCGPTPRPISTSSLSCLIIVHTSFSHQCFLLVDRERTVRERELRCATTHSNGWNCLFFFLMLLHSNLRQNTTNVAEISIIRKKCCCKNVGGHIFGACSTDHSQDTILTCDLLISGLKFEKKESSQEQPLKCFKDITLSFCVYGADHCHH